MPVGVVINYATEEKKKRRKLSLWRKLGCGRGAWARANRACCSTSNSSPSRRTNSREPDHRDRKVAESCTFVSFDTIYISIQESEMPCWIFPKILRTVSRSTPRNVDARDVNAAWWVSICRMQVRARRRSLANSRPPLEWIFYSQEGGGLLGVARVFVAPGRWLRSCRRMTGCDKAVAFSIRFRDFPPWALGLSKNMAT